MWWEHVAVISKFRGGSVFYQYISWDFLLTFHSCPIAASPYAIELTTSLSFPSTFICLLNHIWRLVVEKVYEFQQLRSGKQLALVESSWNVMAHGDAGRGIEGETGEWSGWPVLFTLPRNIVYPALLPLMRTPRLPVVDWTDAPADLNGLVRFAERRNLVSARVPSYFKRILPSLTPQWQWSLAGFVKSAWHGDPVV